MAKKREHNRLDISNVDDLGAMVFALLTELWITRDRLAILEKLLTERGGLHPGEIDDYQPDDEFSAELEALRDHIANEVLGAPLITEGMKVDEILARVGLRRPEAKQPENA